MVLFPWSVCSPVFSRGTFTEPQVTGTGAEAVDGTGVGAGTIGQYRTGSGLAAVK